MVVLVERELLEQVKEGLIKAIEQELSVVEGVELIKAVNLVLRLDKYDRMVIKPKSVKE